jgi:hypothetical protein
MIKPLTHGFKLLRGGNGTDVHPPREQVKVGSSHGGGCGRDHGDEHSHGHSHNHGHKHKHKHNDDTEGLSKDPSAAGKQAGLGFYSISNDLPLIRSGRLTR